MIPAICRDAHSVVDVVTQLRCKSADLRSVFDDVKLLLNLLLVVPASSAIVTAARQAQVVEEKRMKKLLFSLHMTPNSFMSTSLVKPPTLDVEQANLRCVCVCMYACIRCCYVRPL